MIKSPQGSGSPFYMCVGTLHHLFVPSFYRLVSIARPPETYARYQGLEQSILECNDLCLAGGGPAWLAISTTISLPSAVG